MVTALLASPTSVFLLYTLRLSPSPLPRGLLHFMETFDGWLLSCLDTQMMKYQYDQASIVTSTPLAGLCYKYVE